MKRICVVVVAGSMGLAALPAVAGAAQPYAPAQYNDEQGINAVWTATKSKISLISHVPSIPPPNKPSSKPCSANYVWNIGEINSKIGSAIPVSSTGHFYAHRKAYGPVVRSHPYVTVHGYFFTRKKVRMTYKVANCAKHTVVLPLTAH